MASSVPFVLLALAICSVWLPAVRAGSIRIDPWVPLLGLATAAAVLTGVIGWPALMVLAVLSGLVWGSVRSSSAAMQAVLVCLASALAVLMALHMAPGFANPKVFDNVRFSGDAAPFTQYLNFDKGAAGLIFLAAYAPRLRTFVEAGRVGRVALLASVGTSIVVIAAALAVGYVRPDFKVPAGTFAFLATNLFFTCVAEEAFFRGLLQERLARALPASRLQFWLPLVISSVLYGAAHAAGGADFAALATIAGAGYAEPAHRGRHLHPFRREPGVVHRFHLPPPCQEVPCCVFRPLVPGEPGASVTHTCAITEA